MVILLFFQGCDINKNQKDFDHLITIDSLLAKQPEHVLHQLKNIDFNSFNKYNQSYYYLIETIALDKTYFEFTSDSIINLVVKSLQEIDENLSFNLARAYMYQGIVRYRLGATDSTAFTPLKQADAVFSKISKPDPQNHYLCLYYLGEILDSNNNLETSFLYTQKAVAIAKMLNRRDYLFNAYRNLTWSALQSEKLNLAKLYIDSMSQNLIDNDEHKISLKNAQATYYQLNNEAEKSVELVKQILEIKAFANYSYSNLATYNQLSKLYLSLNQLDSAQKYGLLSIQEIQDTLNPVNHFYYKHLAVISERNNQFKLSTDAYKRAYQIISANIDVQLNTNILELEKKYNLKQAENEILKHKNQSQVLAGILLLSLFVLVVFIFYINKLKLIKKLTLARNVALEKENIQNKKELIEKHLILKLFHHISQKNLEIKNLLYDLKINKHIETNKLIFQKISNEYDIFNQKSKLSEAGIISEELLINFTGESKENLALLNAGESELLFLLAIKIETKEIAILLNTTPESIRSRKLKLRKKGFLLSAE